MRIRYYLSYLKQFDWILLGITLILVLYGLAAIYSVTIKAESPDFLRFQRQIIFALVGLIFLFIFSFLNYRILRTYGLVIYFIGVILLVSVLFFGKDIRGTTAWFSLGGQTFQPVEIAKLILIIFLSRYFSDKALEFYKFKPILISGIATGVFIVLLILQPDLGSALIFLGLWLGMFLLMKVKRSHFILVIFILLMIALISWFFVLQDYQKERILTFVNPGRDPLGEGYNITQSILAVGSGKLWGRGLGLGPQSQLNFLPAQVYDFIFAVISEELGFLGSWLILVFFGALFYRIISIIKNISDNFGLFLACGIIISLAIQIFISIGMNLGLMPVAGIPLPFLSAGGSSLIVNLIYIGILESLVIRHRRLIVLR